jgi:hypothetical protein
MNYSKICEELDKLYPHFINDGNCSQIPSQIETFKEIITAIEPKNILEIGMGIGKSSLLFLAESNANVVSLDNCGDVYQQIGKKYIDELFPNRHRLIVGCSSKTLDEITDSFNIKFDIIFIDGGREIYPYSDLINCSFVSHENTIVVMNNYVRNPENYAFWNEGFNNAWNKFLEKKYIEEIDQFDYFWGRGMVTGRYTFDKNNAPLCNIIDYKTMTKSEMFNEAKKMFMKPKEKETKKLEEICELYLNYFEKIDDDETIQIQYYNAFLKMDSDKDNSILLFEKLLKHGDKLEENIKVLVERQLNILYPKSEVDEIPKIIHLLYFGETEFRIYHYRCITSMLKNMPNYQIIIYNNVEPIGNIYWDSIKKYNSIKFEKIVPPSTFDGFELKHFQYKADVVRIEKLYEYGGIYLDIDMLIFKNFERIFNSKHDFYISKEGTQGDGLINAFIASKPKNEFLKIWLDSFKTGLRMSIWAYHIRDANAILLKDNPHYYLKYNICLLNSEEFFSIPWSNLLAFETMNEQTVFGENVYGIHLFETILHHTLMCNPYFSTILDEPLTENIILEIGEQNCKINELVDEVVVLSLKERPEKSQYITEHLNSHGIKHTLILNKLHWAPCIGCFEAHIDAIKYAKNKGLKNVLICEDDASITNINALNNLKDDLPPHWDMFYLGGIMTNNVFNAGKFARGTIWCNHAYIVNNNMYDIILDKFDKCNLADYANKKETIDHFYTNNIHEDYNCFLHIEQPIVQKEGYSDLSKKVKWTNFIWDTFSLKNLSDL